MKWWDIVPHVYRRLRGSSSGLRDPAFGHLGHDVRKAEEFLRPAHPIIGGSNGVAKQRKIREMR